MTARQQLNSFNHKHLTRELSQRPANIRVSSSFFCHGELAEENETVTENCNLKSPFSQFLEPLLCRLINCGNITFVNIDQDLGYTKNANPLSFYARYSNNEFDISSDLFGFSQERYQLYRYAFPIFSTRPAAFVNKHAERYGLDQSTNYIFGKFAAPVWLVLIVTACVLYSLVALMNRVSGRHLSFSLKRQKLATMLAITLSMGTIGTFSCIYAARMRSEALAETSLPIRSIVTLARMIQRNEAKMVTFSLKTLFFEDLNKTTVPSLIFLRSALQRNPPIVLPLEEACRIVAAKTVSGRPTYVLVAQEIYILWPCARYIHLMEQIPLPEQSMGLSSFIVTSEKPWLQELVDFLAISGIIRKLHDRLLRYERYRALANYSQHQQELDSLPAANEDVIDLEDLQLIFVFLTIGYVVGTTICLIEFLISRYEQRAKRRLFHK